MNEGVRACRMGAVQLVLRAIELMEASGGCTCRDGEDVCGHCREMIQLEEIAGQLEKGD